MSNIQNCKIGIIGANGKTGTLLISKLLNLKELENKKNIVAFIRNKEAFIKNIGLVDVEKITTRLYDLEIDDVESLASKCKDIDILVFLAGAGRQGKQRLFSVDLDGVFKCVEVCERLGTVQRFIAVSVLKVEDRKFWWNIEGLRGYFIAKKAADHEIQRSHLNYTILHPGWLGMSKGTGKICAIDKVAGTLVHSNNYLEREDLAEVIVACMLNPNATSRQVIPLINGDLPIVDAINDIH
ncbi:hypothetical protein KAFR_0D03150 [Kazachstania africana CBS 2517]|uniref:NAD(P)-binding domain-containing protein n=1 Tax=Kazachstania africana (strain ATCC 22294 / BCRC 22015 / CBS 2517 / CECT 1963 / NBRC 1671 / NRRL Y-8276) TaxID=1071382 RepID=H2AUB3_KAZAF|nr:hypothetical protein KAFR_0D03150 [Kazachstania africana CBS 2517]CCF57963.1 hypothetical protein KAFR_0D03150 [Kazachstania africana CBS 2517]